MNANNDAPDKSVTEIRLNASLNFDRTVDHLNKAYNNSQSVVRFLDTKAAAVIGVVPIVLGVVAAIFKWAHEVDAENHQPDSASYPILMIFAFASLALILIGFATAAIATAFKTLSPQDTGKSKPSILFPYEQTGFESHLQCFTSAPTETKVINDYQKQINRMSEIVKQKRDGTEKSIAQTRSLLIVSGLCVALTILFGSYRTLPLKDWITNQDNEIISKTDIEPIPPDKSPD